MNWMDIVTIVVAGFFVVAMVLMLVTKPWRSSNRTPRWTPCVIESPYAGDIGWNLKYLRACMRWCLRNGYAPFASHGLYTQPGVLRDENPEERRMGIDAGLAFGRILPVRLVFTDLGLTKGMRQALDLPIRGQVVRKIELGEGWETSEADTSQERLLDEMAWDPERPPKGL